MGIKRFIVIACLAAFGFGLWPGGPAVAQDVRTLTLGSLQLSSGENSWLGSSTGGYSEFLKYGSLSAPAFSFGPETLEPQYFLPQNPYALDSLHPVNSSFLMNQKVGRVFNLSVALSNIKNLGLTSSSNIRAMTGRVGASEERSEAGGSDLWALDVGLDYRDPSGHGVHVGFLYGTDPLTREVDTVVPDKQGVDLGYSYDLDGFYVNLGYVYSFVPSWTSARAEVSDSAFYLRFQLHF